MIKKEREGCNVSVLTDNHMWQTIIFKHMIQKALKRLKSRSWFQSVTIVLTAQWWLCVEIQRRARNPNGTWVLSSNDFKILCESFSKAKQKCNSYYTYCPSHWLCLLHVPVWIIAWLSTLQQNNKAWKILFLFLHITNSSQLVSYDSKWNGGLHSQRKMAVRGMIDQSWLSA